MIAEALIPVFFVMFLGYFAGARRIIDNQQVASLTVLVMTFALPAALQSLSVCFPNFAAVGLPLLGSVMGPGSAINAAVSLAAGSVFISPLAMAVLEARGKAAGSS